MNGATIFFKKWYRNNRFEGNGGGRQKSGYFSLMKYFEPIDVNRTVRTVSNPSEIDNKPRLF